MLSTQKGRQTEQACCEYLSRAGLKLIEKNYRCKLGEVDLVMRDRNTVVFIEVRYRKDLRFGGAIYSIDRKKQRKLINTAQHYMQHAICGGIGYRSHEEANSLGAGSPTESFVRAVFGKWPKNCN